MPPSLLPALEFLRLTDESGKLSLTNLSIYLVLAKIVLASQLALPEVGAFLAALISYQAKRFMVQSAAGDAGDEDIAALKEQLSKLQTSVTAVQLSNGLKPR